MSEAKEVTVKIRDEERSTKHKFLIYEDFRMSEDDPIIAECIRHARVEFKGDPASIKVSVLLVVL